MTHRHRKTALSVAAAATAALVLIAGCSSGDDDAKGSEGTAKESGSGGSTTSAPPVSTSEAGPTTSGAPATAPETAPVAVNIKDPVSKGTPADLGGGVTVILVAADKLDVKARVPGETAGPAVAATLEVRNDTKEPFDLATLAVTASYGDGSPAISNGSEPADDLDGVVAPGKTAKGVYVFRAPKKQSDSVLVEVQSGALPNVLRFRVV